VEDVKLSLERSSLLQGGMMMFDMWGGNKVISPGTNASFDIKVFDLSTGESLAVDNDGGNKGVNCSAAMIVDVTRMSNGENATGNVTDNDVTTHTSLKFMGESLCTITFKTPAAAGIYRVTVNVAWVSSVTGSEAVIVVFIFTV